ncbi:MAG: prepilin-type N-terminal cleavage/methylation domain-containing protein [Candidatus Rokuibacteriota bacterium]|nr:MAG: prepilin-type N-terminal cleavage/methylation domain-containing protein [Candidatus Rokubacteria bacterium]
MSRRSQRGFTLIELLLALTIVGALMAIAFGGLRVAVASWQRGEDRAETHQHVRSVALTLARALSATYPYRASRSLAPEPVVLFAGTDRRVEFVTQTAPFPFAIPIAFTAVVFSFDDTEGLVVSQRPLPNQDPFDKAEVVYRDATVTSLKLSYMDDSSGWKDTWDGAEARATPRAVKLTVTTTLNGRVAALPPLTVSLPIAPPQ